MPEPKMAPVRDPLLWVVWLVGVAIAVVYSPRTKIPTGRALLLIGFAWPIAEEIVFRAGVQGALLRTL